MPGAKRRKIGARSLTRLTLRQQAWLATGGDILPSDEEGIEDEAHAAALWTLHRETVLASGLNCNSPGRRAWGLWRFDVGLKTDAAGRFRWPRGCCSEAETIWRHHADATERLAIEAAWIEAIRIAISQSYAAPNPDPEGHAMEFRGVPCRFYREHAPRILAELEAERTAASRVA